MNIDDRCKLLTPGQLDLLQKCVKRPFNMGSFCSLDDILTKLGVGVIIEPGILKRTMPSFFNDALKYWEEVATRIKKEIEKAETDSEKNKLNEELKRVIEILQPILPQEMSYWTEMPLRGLYDPVENVIKLYPDEMKKEYGGMRMDELLVSTLAHETMHAYFNRPGHKFAYIPTVEEPLAEFGMLLCLKDTGSSYYNWALNDVRGKHTCYKYGANLMDQYLKESSPFPTRQYLEEFKFKLPAYPILIGKPGKVVLLAPKEKGLGVDEFPIGKATKKKSSTLFPIMPPPLPSSATVVPKGTIVVQETSRRQFVLKVFIYLETNGLLGKLFPYIKNGTGGTNQKALQDTGNFNLTGILWDCSIFPPDTRRWFIDYVFDIDDTEYFLSNQWRDNGKKTGLQIDKFIKMINYIYPGKFEIQKKDGKYIMIEL